MKELQTLVDDSQEFPAIDELAFPNTPNEGFWPSKPVSWFPGYAWYVGYDIGKSNHGAVDTGMFHVWCVH